jgi:hypothetical protein
MNVAVIRKTQVSRPLKVLVPLIKDQLSAADQAGLEHYQRAGEMLVEAKGQVPHGSWSRWLTKNFELSQTQARRYIRLARVAEADDAAFKTTPEGRSRTLKDAIGEKNWKPHAEWASTFKAADKVNVTRLADERQARDDEIKLHRELALKLIDLGYRALATKLHPDQGGSRDAMARLNAVRDQLKDIATTRRFV